MNLPAIYISMFFISLFYAKDYYGRGEMVDLFIATILTTNYTYLLSVTLIGFAVGDSNMFTFGVVFGVLAAVCLYALDERLTS